MTFISLSIHVIPKYVCLTVSSHKSNTRPTSNDVYILIQMTCTFWYASYPNMCVLLFHVIKVIQDLHQITSIFWYKWRVYLDTSHTSMCVWAPVRHVRMSHVTNSNYSCHGTPNSASPISLSSLCRAQKSSGLEMIEWSIRCNVCVWVFIRVCVCARLCVYK